MIPRMAYRRYRGRRYSFKQELGSKLYYLTLLLLVTGSYKIFELRVFDEFWIVVLGVVSYKLVGFVLRTTGIWRPTRPQ
jgi:hypothetical protein